MATTREVSYPADELVMVGHLARPEGHGPWPTVLLAHDGIGLDDFQRHYADDLAERSYLTLAMEYHGGRWFSDPDEMLARCLPLLADPDRMHPRPATRTAPRSVRLTSVEGRTRRWAALWSGR